ncbi:MAG TPA: O-antigen ligase family protein, partial [Chthonomonadaceae bacterium]|nr:O-antigen ligase family protein [Chthonomonadaceae bacterium]
LIVITAGLLFALSRGAWIAALGGVFIVLGYRGKFKFVLQVMIVLIPLIAIYWNLMPDDKKDYATNFNEKSVNISARYQSIEFARNQFLQSPLYGGGVGLRKEFDATNIFWVTLAETGIPGLIAFAAIQVVYLLMVRKTQKFVPVSNPMFSLLVVGAGLMVSRLIHGLVDHYWSRGALLIAWASVGMTVAVYFHVRKQIAIQEAKRPALWPARPSLTSDLRTEP